MCTGGCSLNRNVHTTSVRPHPGPAKRPSSTRSSRRRRQKSEGRITSGFRSFVFQTSNTLHAVFRPGGTRPERPDKPLPIAVQQGNSGHNRVPRAVRRRGGGGGELVHRSRFVDARERREGAPPRSHLELGDQRVRARRRRAVVPRRKNVRDSRVRCVLYTGPHTTALAW